MAAWTSYDQSVLIYKAFVEIGDWPNPTYRWVADSEARAYLDEWYDIIQEELELVWGTASIALGSGTATLTETSLATNILRLDRCYWSPAGGTSTYLLVPRAQEDLYLSEQGWQQAGSGQLPQVIYPIAYGTWALWPTPPAAGTLHAEYPIKYRYPTGTATGPLPAWTREWPSAYIAYRVYSKFGPLQDLPRAAVYKRQHEHNLEVGRKLRDLYFPASEAGVLRPGRGFNSRILQPSGRLL